MKNQQGSPEDPHTGEDAKSPEEVEAYKAYMRAQYARIAGVGLSLLDDLIETSPREEPPRLPEARKDSPPPSEAP